MCPVPFPAALPFFIVVLATPLRRERERGIGQGERETEGEERSSRPAFEERRSVSVTRVFFFVRKKGRALLCARDE